jgi:hypothetical protein
LEVGDFGGFPANADARAALAAARFLALEAKHRNFLRNIQRFYFRKKRTRSGRPDAETVALGRRNGKGPTDFDKTGGAARFGDDYSLLYLKKTRRLLVFLESRPFLLKFLGTTKERVVFFSERGDVKKALSRKRIFVKSTIKI